MSTLTTFRSTTSTRPLVAVTSDAKLAGTGLLDAAFGGQVTFSKVRETGTLRAWPLLAPGTPLRKLAEDIEVARKGGATVDEVARLLHKSVPTVRRLITSLAFTQELEGMSAKDRAALAKAAVANAKALAEKAKPATPAKPEAKKPEPKAPAAPKGEAKAGTKAPAKPKAPKETSAQRLARIKAAKAAESEKAETPAEA